MCGAQVVPEDKEMIDMREREREGEKVGRTRVRGGGERKRAGGRREREGSKEREGEGRREERTEKER